MKVEYIDHMGNDSSVVKAARVSFAGDNEEARGDIGRSYGGLRQ